MLHHGGRSARWGNLGLWSATAHDGRDFAAANEALADAVARAAALAHGDRVLSLACGAGEELRRWRQRYGAQDVLGVERNPRLAALARALCDGDSGVSVTAASARRAALPPASFDAVVCVDAAYHLSPRATFLHTAFAALREGGHLAFTDLVLDAPADRASTLHLAGALCGVRVGELCSVAAQMQRMDAAGFEHVHAERLDDAALGGFTRFVAAQGARLGMRAWRPAWWRVALTAWLIPACRTRGLGYALYSGSRRATAS